jgi:hypothetical protein
MFNKIKDKIYLAALIPQIYAQQGGGTIEFDPGTNYTGIKTVTVGGIITGGIKIVMIVVSIVFFFILIFGGLKWVTSGGDEKKVAAARSQITNALIGLAIILAAWAIISLIGTLFGVQLLQNFNFTKFG